jgi:hypothetical protein
MQARGADGFADREILKPAEINDSVSLCGVKAAWNQESNRRIPKKDLLF